MDWYWSRKRKYGLKRCMRRKGEKDRHLFNLMIIDIKNLILSFEVFYNLKIIKNLKINKL
jgi:hypothetical protein